MNAVVGNNLSGLLFRKCRYGKSLKASVFKPRLRDMTSMPCEKLAVSF